MSSERAFFKLFQDDLQYVSAGFKNQRIIQRKVIAITRYGNFGPFVSCSAKSNYNYNRAKACVTFLNAAFLFDLLSND